MKNFTHISIAFLLFIIGTSQLSYGQGCVAIRGGCGNNVGGGFINKGEWLISPNFRYFKSYKHFSGTEEHKNRVAEGSQVINHSYFLDISVNYAFTDRLFASFVLPLVYHERSSMYEHGGNPSRGGLGERHKTYAQGLGDIRFGINYWALNPAKHHKANFSVGLGMKLPTGEYGAKGMFYNQGQERNIDRVEVVDQSIQPGDGGYGATVDLQGYYMLSNHFTLSGSFFYLLNPMATNGVLRRGGRAENAEFDEFSVPDQYAFRLGGSYMPVQGFSLYLGGRMECVPSSDLIGSSEGYRRPGYAISVEPGLNYSTGNFSALVTVPVAVERNRTKSYTDKIRGSHGDAAFADYLINVGLTYRIGKKTEVAFPALPQ